GLSPEQLEITDAALSEIITSYTREAGVRQLEREIGKLGRKVARKIADGGAERIRVDAGDVDDLIGRPKVHPEHKAGEDQVGVTMATALVSALSRRSARHDLAMTGEITLRGRVLPIGGVKEKVLGAVRAGIRTVVLPKENGPDLEDLPEDVRSSLEVHLVEDLDEVLTLALRGARFEAGHLVFDGDAPVEPSLVAKHN